MREDAATGSVGVERGPAAMEGSPPEVRVSRARRIAFFAWVGFVTTTLGIVFFGLTTLGLGWFARDDGLAIPVTELGYGALVGILITVGLLAQLRSPERKIAGVQQAALGGLALLISAPLAANGQNLVPGLLILCSVGIVIALHPARREFLMPSGAFSPGLAAVVVLGAGPLVVYALRMAAQARELSGPPHHIQRLAWMAALAIAVVVVGLLAALQTRGWRIPAWCAASAVLVFGVASMVFPHHWGSAGGGWGAVAVGGGLLFIVVAEGRARRWARSARAIGGESHCQAERRCGNDRDERPDR